MLFSSFFFLNAPPTTEIYTLPLHDALPIPVTVPLSASVYVSALNVPPLDTSVWPAAPAPDRFVGVPPVPVAVNVHSDSAAVPPLSLVTILSSTSDGGLSLLMMVHIALSPLASKIGRASCRERV